MPASKIASAAATPPLAAANLEQEESTASRRWFRLGVAGLAAILVSLALLIALGSGPFQSADENEHVSYALDVSHGFLPTLHTLVSVQIPGMHHGVTYTANHPPLFYLLEAFPLRTGIALGHPLAGFFLGRLLNIAFAVVGLLMLIWLARTVMPHRPSMALVAPLVVVSLPLSLAVSGQIYNDAAAVAASTAALACCCRLLLLGPSRGRLMAASAAALAAVAVRATGLEVVGLTVLSAAAAEAIHRPPAVPIKRMLRSSLAAASAVAGIVLAGIGWFYLRNMGLYGDLTGADVILRHFPGTAFPPTLRRTPCISGTINTVASSEGCNF